MKIVCDNCTTKYQIADEKVSGKAFKIRCKKCGHVIVVNKSPGETSSAQQPQPDAGAAPADAAAPPPAEPAPPSDAVWHLVIDREQVGPMTAEEVKAKIKSGQVDAETYGWKEGFDDWLKLSAIDNFKGDFVARDDQATRRAEPAAAPAERPAAEPSADLFNAAGMARAASSAAPTLMTDNAGGDAMMARSAAVEPPMSSGQESEALGAGKGMKGARSENSVLFSLNNLSALAGGGESPGRPGASASADKPGYANVQSEASGLIDIRAMAAAHLSSSNQAGPSSSRGPDMLLGGDIAPVFAPVATNMLLPSAEPQGIPKWVYALVGVGALAIIGMIVFLVIYLQSPAQPTVVATGPTAGSTGPGVVPSPGTTGATAPSTGPSGPDTAATKPASAGTSPPSTPTPPTKPASADSGSSSGRKSSRDKGDKGGDKPSGKGGKDSSSASSKPAEKEPEIPAPPPKAEPPKKDKAPKAKDDLDSLLDSASSGSGGKPKAAEKKDLPEQLTRDQISSGFKSANTSSCKGEGASGIYNVKLTIGRNGKVSDATVVSGGEGKDCVAKAVKGARFPEFSGDPMSLTYPFIVR